MGIIVHRGGLSVTGPHQYDRPVLQTSLSARCQVMSVPKSRSKRSTYTPPKPPKPKPSPPWLPWLGIVLVLLGLVVILLHYVVAAFPGGNWNLLIGFGLMAGGLVVLSQWR